MLRRQLADQAHPREVDAAQVLGRVCFGGAGQHGQDRHGLELRVPLDVVAGQAPVVDLWLGAAPVRLDRIAGVDVATDGRRLFGYAHVDERSAGGLRAATRQAYASIFAALDRGACAHPLRFWNYVPRINQTQDGLERYRDFNVGRQEAFLAARRPAFAGAPAACAIGTARGALTVYFVAAQDAPIALENPRQVSAYHYPVEYGPRSPTFSRATLVTGGSPMLFISGTASVVGHRSEHAGDATAQTRETFVNLRTLVDIANRGFSVAPFALDRLLYTVYVRNAAYCERVRRQFVAEVGARSAASQRAVFLEGDICRAELLVEIEAVGSGS